MIKIAICDDETSKSELVEKYVENYMNSKLRVYEKQVFTSSRALLCEIADGSVFDVLLLDIEMPVMDGINLSEAVKSYLPDVLIIFITDYEKYVYESFKVHPFRFVPRKYLDNMLSLALRDAVDFIDRTKDKYFYVENQSGMEKIPTRNISYIRHREKYAYIEKTDGTSSKVRKTLKQVFSELPEGDFIWIDRGCICSLIQISRISEGDILLVDGTRLQVSRDRLTEVKRTLKKYWIGDVKGS